MIVLLSLIVCLVVMPGAALAQVQEKEYAQSYHESFKGAAKISPEYEFSGPEAHRYVKLDAAGLHLSLPKGEPTIGSHPGLIANLVIKGDFEITVGFELANESAPQGTKFGTGISMTIALDTPDKNRASIARVTRWNSKLFTTYMDFLPPGADKPLRPFNPFPAQAAAGRLRMVRSGAEVSYYVAEESDNDFRFLRTDPFRPDDVKQVHITGTVGGPDAWLDAHVIDLCVRADAIAASAMPPPVVPSSVRRSHRWLVVALLSALTIGTVLALGFLRRKRGGLPPHIQA